MREPVARRRAAGVVDEDVEAAVRLDRAGDHLGGRVRVHEVDGDVQAPSRSGAVREATTTCAPSSRKCSRDGEADALGGAGDDGHTAVEFQIHILPTRGGAECEVQLQRDLARGERGRGAVGEVDQQRAGLVDAGARALAVLPAHVLSEQRVAVAQGGERGVAVLRQVGAPARSGTRRGSARPAPGRGRACRRSRPPRAGRLAGSSATLTPIPSTAQSWPCASARMPATLRPSIQTSLGHFTRAAGPRRRRRRARRAAAAGRRRTAAPAKRRSRLRRRHPAAALAPAAGGLLAGGHERAVGGALLGQFARALVGRADRLVVLAGLSQGHAGDDTASASTGDQPVRRVRVGLEVGLGAVLTVGAGRGADRREPRPAE